MKKVLTVIITIMLAVTLFGCSHKEKDDKLNIWFVCQESTSSAYGIYSKSFLAECEKLSVEATIVAPKNAGSISEMVDLCQQAITDKADVLICDWCDYDSFKDVAKKANDSGIILLGFNQRLSDDLGSNYFGIDLQLLGKTIAETLVENRSTEDLNVLYLGVSDVLQSHLLVEKGFKDRIAEIAPNATIVYEYSNNNSGEIKNKIIDDMNSYGHTEIVCACPIAALEACKYKKDNQLSDNALYVQGIEGSLEMLEYVDSGIAACTVIEDFQSVGVTAAQLAVKLAKGEQISSYSRLSAYPLYKDGVEAFMNLQIIQ